MKLLRFLDKLRGAQLFKMMKLTGLICMIAHWVRWWMPVMSVCLPWASYLLAHDRSCRNHADEAPSSQVACSYCMLASLETASSTWVDVSVRRAPLPTLLCIRHTSGLQQRRQRSQDRCIRLSRLTLAPTSQEQAAQDDLIYVLPGSTTELYASAFYQV